MKYLLGIWFIDLEINSQYNVKKQTKLQHSSYVERAYCYKNTVYKQKSLYI